MARKRQTLPSRHPAQRMARKRQTRDAGSTEDWGRYGGFWRQEMSFQLGPASTPCAMHKASCGMTEGLIIENTACLMS
jgi:hypothetical protein